MPRGPNATCSICSKPVYRGHTSRPEIVCNECRRKEPGRYGDGPRIAPREATCAWSACGKTFTTQPSGHSPTGRTVYCSKSCATSAGNRARTGTLNLSPEQRQERQKAKVTAKNRKRRMRLNAAPWDGVTDEAILERDRWTCRMPACIYGSRRISKTRKFPDRRSASIDHILPLSLGGDDTQYNKRAAHLGCNVTRNTQLDDQMPLAFGADLDAIPRFYQPRQKLCPICNDPIDGKRCDLHMPVYYFTCRGCGNLAASRYKNSQVCGSPECRHAGYLRRVQAREPHKRALQAHVMHEQGMPWSEIAGRLGYSAANVAASAAARATGKRSARKQGEYIRLPRVSVPGTHQASA